MNAILIRGGFNALKEPNGECQSFVTTPVFSQVSMTVKTESQAELDPLQGDQATGLNRGIRVEACALTDFQQQDVISERNLN